MMRNRSSFQKSCVHVRQGIHFLHAHNVIHSDLKTSNILLDRSQATAKISDVRIVVLWLWLCI